MQQLDFRAPGGGTIPVNAGELEGLAGAFRGDLLDCAHHEYEQARSLWNGMISTRPGLIARCAGVADVVAAVGFARDHGIQLAVRAGGHNVAGVASCEGGLVIDIANMRGVRVDPRQQLVRAQAGATLGDLDRETDVFGLSVPAGVVSTTGIGGLTLGGGTGWQMRKWGLTIDNLRSADVVVASGEVVVASAEENPDLFWGLRGGGGTFGVVTSFEYEAHPTGPLVSLGDPWYAAADAPMVLRAFRDFFRDAPDEVSGAFVFTSIPAIPAVFPEALFRHRVVQPALVHVGPTQEGMRIIEPIRRLAEPLIDLSGNYPWPVMQSLFDPLVPPGDLYYWKSTYLASLDDVVIDKLCRYAAASPSVRSQVIVSPLGGSVARVGASDTAFGPRDMPFMLSIDAIWSSPAETEQNIAWTREFWSAMQEDSTGGLYLNFAGLAEEDDLVASALGEQSHAQLVAVKDAWDPADLFQTRLGVRSSRAAADGRLALER